MSSPRHFRIFLASPGDVADERSIALKIVKDLPYDPQLRGKVTLEAVAWDAIGGPPMEANLTPQEAIRRGLPLPSACDIFLSVFWTRIGTPVEIEGRQYQSGTHYEFEDAMRGNRESGLPRVLVYKREDVPALKLDDANFDEKRHQYQSLEAFFANFRDSESGRLVGGYNGYKAPNDYREHLESHLRFILSELLQENEQKQNLLTPETRTDLKNYSVTAAADEEWKGSPFPGLRAFDITDEPIFFGRGRETDLLAKRVRENDFTAVVGASGSGKSSLVAAGLIPRLMSTARGGRILTITTSPDHLGSGNPFAALAAALLRICHESKEKTWPWTWRRSRKNLPNYASNSDDLIPTTFGFFFLSISSKNSLQLLKRSIALRLSISC